MRRVALIRALCDAGKKKPQARPQCEWVRVAAPELRIVDDELRAAAHA
jgi:hypothetical protein